MLVVDDDVDIRDALRELLEEEGYSVLTAANGQEALDALARLPEAPVILLDLLMPVMSGWEVLDALRQQGSAVPIVVLSAAADSAKVMMAGATRFIQKPLELDDLLDTLALMSARTPPPSRPS